MESKHTEAIAGKQFESLELPEWPLKSHKSSIKEPTKTSTYTLEG
ncbi:hypothetical protein TIFTF001_014334 [Ficus carica]|uniref:Uncharacterized protein n=1 Tax=Ficus carica TaxID=3494 RepID=A0AA88AJG2_FICCA|nr:hypothetical protein TIFTF001_014334 [Ficus carica]